MLYIVATPIGNLGDVTYRAIEVLGSVGLIAAEDTRRTKRLLDHYKISKTVISYTEHNEKIRIPNLISLMEKGEDVALVSDSGTPAVSDPGFKLIREVISHGIDVFSIPGPCAAISGLVSSGLPTDKFAFYGFLPKKKKAIEDFFLIVKAMEETVIVYESKHRIEKTLSLIEKILPEKNICVARELTKKFEEIIRGKPAEVISKIGSKKLKGEIVIVIGKK